MFHPLSRGLLVFLASYSAGMIGLGLYYGASQWAMAANGFMLGVSVSSLVVNWQVRRVQTEIRGLFENALRAQRASGRPMPEAYLEWARRMLEESNDDEGKPTQH